MTKSQGNIYNRICDAMKQNESDVVIMILRYSQCRTSVVSIVSYGFDYPLDDNIIDRLFPELYVDGLYVPLSL